jgi:hypothetical protein
MTNTYFATALVSAHSIGVTINANKTGRPRDDFQVEEISRERYEKLKQFFASS